MSEIKHTPGPWKFKTDHLKGDCGIHAEGTGIFAEVFSDIRRAGEGNRTEALANARLIAASPDLLAALYHVAVLGHGKCTIGKPLADMVRAAITKAEGGAA